MRARRRDTEIHRLIEGSQLCIFKDSSHSIRNDEPGRMRDEITGFPARNQAR